MSDDVAKAHGALPINLWMRREQLAVANLVQVLQGLTHADEEHAEPVQTLFTFRRRGQFLGAGHAAGTVSDLRQGAVDLQQDHQREFFLDDRVLRIGELPALSQADIVAIQTRVSQRVLRWFVRRGWLEADEARAMRDWHNDGGFSLDAAVRIPAWDRAGLERLLRCCARPPFALDRIEAVDDAHLRYHLSKPQLDGTTERSLSPLELIDRIAALVPPPRVHRHRYHGVLAPNSPLRDQVTALVPEVAAVATRDAQASDADQTEPEIELDQRIQW